MMKSVLFWLAVGIVAWLGLRHLFSILTGCSQDGLLKPGQRLCHATSLLLLMGSSIIAVTFSIWWPLLAGVVSEHLFRRLTVWTGKTFPLSEEERQMSWKEFFKHITDERRNDKT
jgi:hypothetical protein